MMKDFAMAALPWVCIGIAIALCAANAGGQKEEQGSFMVEGMCFGMCVGLSLGTVYTTYGMLAGTLIGMCLKKRKNTGDTD